MLNHPIIITLCQAFFYYILKYMLNRPIIIKFCQAFFYYILKYTLLLPCKHYRLMKMRYVMAKLFFIIF